MHGYVVLTLVEMLLQLHYVRMVQVLRDLELPVFVAFVLQDVLHCEQPVIGVQHLGQETRTKNTLPKVPLPISLTIVYSFSFSAGAFYYYLYIGLYLFYTKLRYY
jgi:hypothetical protein